MTGQNRGVEDLTGPADGVPRPGEGAAERASGPVERSPVERASGPAERASGPAESASGPAESASGRDDGEPPVAVVTGASSGIGLAAAEGLARRGWRLALVGRDPGRLESAMQQVRALTHAPVEAYRCDFARLAEVRELAARLLTRYPRTGVLANIAGGVVPHRRSTVDGYEETIQTNHLAAFLLSHELRPALRGGRIINTSSRAHQQGRLNPDDLSSTRQRYVALVVYGSAKQANIAFTVEATKRWP